MFDVAIIGTGLAALICGIRLVESGKRCAIIKNNLPIFHYSSHSLDLLCSLPDGSPIYHPKAGLEELQQQAPQHPYSLLGKEKVCHLAEEAEKLLCRCGLKLLGHYKKNHWMLTATGKKKLTWLSPPHCYWSFSEKQTLPTSAIIVGINNYSGFYPDIIANTLKEQHINACTHYINITPSNNRNNRPMNTLDIAHYLEEKDNFSLFIEKIHQLSPSFEKIILPFCFDIKNNQLYYKLCNAINKHITLLPTLPPSIFGLKLDELLHTYFQQKGGLFINEDIIQHNTINNERNYQIHFNSIEQPLITTKNIVVANTLFFNKGLLTDTSCAHEPLFDLDLMILSKQGDWLEKGMISPQPYTHFGIKTDNQFNVRKKGHIIENIYGIGSVLTGYDALKQGCSAGVSLITALAVANQIISR